MEERARPSRLPDLLLGGASGLTAGVLLGALFGPVAAVLGGLGLALLVGKTISVVRRSRLGRALVLLLLALWFGVAAFEGIRAASLRPPGAVETPAVAAAPDPAPFEAGFAHRAFDLPADSTLAGWGTPPRRRALPAYGGLGVIGRLSLRWMGPVFRQPETAGEALGARAVVLRGRDGPPLGLVRLDLILVDRRTVARIAEGVRDLGFTPATLLVQASHTHSGPGGVLSAPLAEALGTDHHDPRVVDAVVAAAEGALRQAFDAAVPARVSFLQATDAGPDGRPVLAKLRGAHVDRDAEAAQRIDARVLVMRLEAREGGTPIAWVVHYAVQPVVVRPRNLVFSSDLPGAVESALAARLPGAPPVLFLNGHCGDVTPKRDGLAGVQGARVLAERFAASIAPALEGDAPRHERLAVHAARATRDLGSPYALAALGSRRAFERHVLAGPFGADPPQALAAVLSLPPNLLLWGLGLTEARVGFTFAGAVGGVVDLDEAIGGSIADAGAVILETGTGPGAVLLWHPGVATQALLAAWRADVEARGLPTPFVLGTTGGAIGYLVTSDEYEAGRYEAMASLYGSEGARLVRELWTSALVAARRSWVGLPAPVR